MFIVAAAFIAGFLMSEVWRLIAARGGRGNQIQQGLVGKVGARKVTVDEYRNAVAYITDKYRKDNQLRELSNEDYQAIENQAWDFLVSELTWFKLLKDAKVGVTEQEVVEIMKANPPEAIRNNPELMDSAGQFNQEKYLNAMNNPENRPFFANYFQELFRMLPKEKLRIDALNSYRMTRSEVAAALRAQASVWRVTSLYFGPKLVGDRPEPSDEEALAYYKEHQDEYRTKEIRQFQYVLFPVSVSTQDSADARATIDRAQAQLDAGEDFNLTMLDYSELTAETMPPLVPRDRLDPATDSILKGLKPGGRSRAYFAQYGWQIVTLDSARADSVAVRRILVRVKTATDAVAAVRDSVRMFLEQVKEENFDSVASRMGLAVARARPMAGGEANLAGLELYAPYAYTGWARRAKPGEVMPDPVRGASGYHVFRMAELTPARVQEFEKVKQSARWRVRQQKDKELWLAEGRKALEAIRAGSTLEQLAAGSDKLDLLPETFNGLLECRRRKGAEFAGAVLALDSGQVSGLTETNWGAFIIRCDGRDETGQLAPQTIAQQRQEQVSRAILDGFLKHQKIEDYRDPFSY